MYWNHLYLITVNRLWIKVYSIRSLTQNKESLSKSKAAPFMVSLRDNYLDITERKPCTILTASRRGKKRHSKQHKSFIFWIFYKHPFKFNLLVFYSTVATCLLNYSGHHEGCLKLPMNLKQPTTVTIYPLVDTMHTEKDSRIITRLQLLLLWRN